MRSILRSYLINLFSLWTAERLIPGLTINGNVVSLLLVASGQTIFFTFLKPLLKILFLPVSIITLGASTMLVNALLFYALDYFFDEISVQPWTFPGASYDGFIIPQLTFGIIATYIIIAVLISIVTTFLHWVRK